MDDYLNDAGVVEDNYAKIALLDADDIIDLHTPGSFGTYANLRTFCTNFVADKFTLEL